MRSFRDSFYDKSDVFIAFIIIAAAAIVIALRINAIMEYPSTLADTNTDVKAQAEEPADKTSDTSADKTSSSDSQTSENDKKSSDSSASSSDKKDSDKSSSDKKSSDKKSSDNSSSSSYVTIKITDLDSSADITAMLKKEGLIKSSERFEQTLKDNKLTTKLKSGSFKIKKGASVKQIIKQLTGESI